MSTGEQRVANQECDSDAEESVELNECTPQAAIRPLWAIEGSHCLARWNEDGVWYEAQVLRHVEPNLCMVLFVGNVKEVKDLGVEQLLRPAMLNGATKSRVKGELKSKSLKQGESDADQSNVKIESKGSDSREMWKSGSVCIAKWTDDGVWYRAQVLEVLEGNFYTVCFVDYGNTATTTSTDMVSSRNKVPERQIIDECVPKDREEGSACLALYKEEMIWCRAKLVEKTKRGWEVEFTDYEGEMAEVEEGDLADSINEVPLGQNVDSAVLNCVGVEIDQSIVVDEVEVKRGGVSHDEKQGGGNKIKKELSSKELLMLELVASSEGEDCYVTMASHCNDEAVVDEEPSMEMETAHPPKPVVPMPAPAASSSEAATLNTGSPVLLLQPEDM